MCSALTLTGPAGVSNSVGRKGRATSRSTGPESRRRTTEVISTAAMPMTIVITRAQNRYVRMTNACYFRVDRGRSQCPIYRASLTMSWLSTARLPQPYNSERLAVAWTRWRETAAMPDDPAGTALLDALFGNSPYLTETALQNPSFMADLWHAGPDAVLKQLDHDVGAVCSEARSVATPEAVAGRLRRLKRSVSLTV